MVNVIDYDDKLIGFLPDVTRYIKYVIASMEFEQEEVPDDVTDLYNELQQLEDDGELLVITRTPMGNHTIKKVNINDD